MSLSYKNRTPSAVHLGSEFCCLTRLSSLSSRRGDGGAGPARPGHNIQRRAAPAKLNVTVGPSALSVGLGLMRAGLPPSMVLDSAYRCGFEFFTRAKCPLWVKSGHWRTDGIRFTPKSRHQSDVAECPLCAKSRHREAFSPCPLYPQKRTSEMAHGSGQ